MLQVAAGTALLDILVFGFLILQMMQGVYEGGEVAILFGFLVLLLTLITTVLCALALRKSTLYPKIALALLIVSWLPIAIMFVASLVAPA